MPNYFTRLFQTRTRYWLLLLAMLVFGAYQMDKTIREDDDLIGEQVYFLLHDGHVKSEMMRGYGNLGLENHQTVFHKLFVYCGAIVCKIGGWSLYSLHATSLIFAGLFFFILFRYFRTNEKMSHPGIFPFVVVFLLICYNVLYYSGCFRPEIMLMGLGLLSWMYLERYLNKVEAGDLIVSALAAGLAFSGHPHGIIYCVGGFLLLVINKKWLPSLLFGLIAGTAFAGIYFADILYFRNFPLFWFQLSHDPIIHLQDHSWYTPLLKLAEEQARLLYNEREVMITLLLVIGVAFNFRALFRAHRNLLFYTLILMVTLGVYSYSKSPQYLLLFLPFFAMIIGYSWELLEATAGHPFKKYLYRTLLCGYAAVHLVFAGLKISKNVSNINEPSLAALSARVADQIPGTHKNLSVLSYDRFIFNEILHFRRIQTLTLYSFFAEMQGMPKYTLPAVVQHASTSGIDYILLNKEYLNYFEVNETVRQALYNNPACSVYVNTDSLIILKVHAP